MWVTERSLRTDVLEAGFWTMWQANAAPTSLISVRHVLFATAIAVSVKLCVAYRVDTEQTEGVPVKTTFVLINDRIAECNGKTPCDRVWLWKSRPPVCHVQLAAHCLARLANGKAEVPSLTLRGKLWLKQKLRRWTTRQIKRRPATQMARAAEAEPHKFPTQHSATQSRHQARTLVHAFHLEPRLLIAAPGASAN